MNDDGMFERGEGLAAKGRLMPAIEAFEEAGRAARDPAFQALARYDIGVAYWHLLGNGEAARREFYAVADICDEHGDQFPRHLRVLHPNALENAMLCATSFDEFEALAGRLRAQNPYLPIITRLVPEVQQDRENGERWSSRLMTIAHNYYDPSLDTGRYGEAVSTYQVLLHNRRDLRLSRDLWRTAVSEYCAVALRLFTDCVNQRGGDDDRDSPEEFLPIATETFPLVDEYLAANPGDETVEEIRRRTGEFVDRFRQRWAALSG